MTEDRDHQRGQILVIVAGGMLALIALAALVLEGGTLILNRRDGQNAADLAAVAGARMVALNYTDGGRTPADVHAAIEDVVEDNGCVDDAGTPCDWDARFVRAGLADAGSIGDVGGPLPAGSLGVLVSVNRHPGAIIGRLPPIGRDAWDVSTEATAISARPSSYPTGIMLPIAVCGWGETGDDPCPQATDTPPPSNVFRFDPYVITDLTNGKDAPGGFGWLSWDGSNSAGALEDAVCPPPSSPSFSLDSAYDSPGSYGGYIGTNPATGETWFPIDPGKSNKNGVRDCLDEWIASEATVLIPIYDIVTGNGNNAAYHITGVAAFVLTSRDQPAIDNIQGYFVEYYPYTDIPGGVGTQPPGPEDTTFFLGLVR